MATNLLGKPQADVARTIERIVARQQLPHDVKGFKIEFGEDSSGVAAVWVWLEVDEDLKPPQEKITTLGQLERTLTAALLNADLGVWPYVGFRVPHPAQE